MLGKYQIISQLKEESTNIAKFSVHHQKHFQSARKEKVNDLAQVKPGDHVSFYKNDLSYSHHGIIYEIHTDSLILIHYFNTAANAWNSLLKGSLYLAEIIQSEWKVDLNSCTEEMYLHHYDHMKCFSHEETIQRARNELGKRGYSLINNNCEHWARWCRTGDSYSEQVYNVCHFFKRKAATILIVDPTALFVKDLSTVATASLGTFLSSVGSGVILGTVETISTAIDIRRRYNERREGSLSDVAFKKYVVRRVTSASTTVIGGIAGTIVGTILIPVPIIGSAVGGMLGTLSGKILGSLSGIPIAKLVELYHRHKHENLGEIETISQLMVTLKCNNETIFQGLMTSVSQESNEGIHIENIVEQRTDSSCSTLHLFFEQLIRQYPMLSNEQCLIGTQLTKSIFLDSDDSEHFILTPIPDQNAPEQFSSTVDLLVLRWPKETPQPWNSTNEEHVLHIDHLNVQNE